jgi:phage recombination protein Bet
MSQLFPTDAPAPTRPAATAEPADAPKIGPPLTTEMPPAVIPEVVGAEREPIPRKWTDAEIELAKAMFFKAWPAKPAKGRERTPKHEPYDWELSLFLYRWQYTGLDPMSNQMCAVWRWDSRKNDQVMTLQTQIDGYRLVAERSGRYAGSDDAVFVKDERGGIGSATVTVYKLLGGQRCPFTATARYSEYCPGEGWGLWDKMPHGQLAKCAEALALRKAFPNLGGIYTDVEMMQAEPPEPGADPIENKDAPKVPPRAERNGKSPVAEYVAEADAADARGAEQAAEPRGDSWEPEPPVEPTETPAQVGERLLASPLFKDLKRRWLAANPAEAALVKTDVETVKARFLQWCSDQVGDDMTKAENWTAERVKACMGRLGT